MRWDCSGNFLQKHQIVGQNHALVRDISHGDYPVDLCNVPGYEGISCRSQSIQLRGMNAEGFRMALVIAMFSICGFESAATLGVESDSPLKSVPRALLSCPMISGAFFVFAAYCLPHAFPGGVQALAKCDSPLLPLSQSLGFPLLGQLAVAGAALSFFACTLASINAGARTLFTMAREGRLPSLLATTHTTNKTPHIAISVIASLGIIPGLALLLANQAPVDIVGWTGTLSTYGFVFAYAAVSLAAALYLHKLKSLTASKIVVAIASAVFMLGSFAFSLYPVPSSPYCWLPYIFLAYIAAGGLWFWLRRRSTSPSEFGLSREKRIPIPLLLPKD